MESLTSGWHELGGARITLDELPARLWSEVDRIEAEAVVRIEAESHGITCRAGCGACCRQLVTISPAEAWAFIRWVNALDEAERETCHARFDEAERALEVAGLTARLLELNDPVLDDAGHYGLAREYFRLRLACPFLRDEACSIHEIRPLVCREYSVTSPATHCAHVFDDEHHDKIRRVERDLEVSTALGLVSARKAGLRTHQVPLALARLWSARHPCPDETFDAELLVEQILELASILRHPQWRQGASAGGGPAGSG